MIGSQGGAGAGAVRGGNKQKRLEKELLQLRNLPREYKLGKRETPLGTLLYVTITFYSNAID
jgi:hypothetical protein